MNGWEFFDKNLETVVLSLMAIATILFVWKQ
jgi:hypothetical protein